MLGQTHSLDDVASIDFVVAMNCMVIMEFVFTMDCGCYGLWLLWRVVAMNCDCYGKDTNQETVLTKDCYKLYAFQCLSYQFLDSESKCCYR